VGANDYEFVTRWRIPGTLQEVSDILEDVEALPRWWSPVYLSVKVLEPGGKAGRGRRVALLTRGRLPYTLRWTSRMVESHSPEGYVLEASGDLVGRGEWILRQDGGLVDVIYEWRVHANKPILRALSFLLKPLFSWNHRWAMARGEECLLQELARRRGLRATAGAS
jgi:hypothetical protein